nr:hypothetical protein CFP56_13312 [Quercus suber]
MACAVVIITDGALLDCHVAGGRSIETVRSRRRRRHHQGSWDDDSRATGWGNGMDVASGWSQDVECWAGRPPESSCTLLSSRSAPAMGGMPVIFSSERRECGWTRHRRLNLLTGPGRSESRSRWSMVHGPWGAVGGSWRGWPRRAWPGDDRQNRHDGHDRHHQARPGNHGGALHLGGYGLISERRPGDEAASSCGRMGRLGQLDRDLEGALGCRGYLLLQHLTFSLTGWATGWGTRHPASETHFARAADDSPALALPATPVCTLATAPRCPNPAVAATLPRPFASLSSAGAGAGANHHLPPSSRSRGTARLVISTMPSRTSTSTTTTVRPVVVEVKPSNLKAKSHFAPPSPGSPKAVRFAEAASVRQVPRRLSTVESWSCYHFETHARTCAQCYNPLDVHRRGDRLCALGQDLAQDVAEHFYYQDGQVYSTQHDHQKHLHVELDEGHEQVQQLLRSKARARRSTHRTVPIISYEPADDVRPPPRVADDVYLEPGTSRRKSGHRSSRYNTIVEQPRHHSTDAHEDERAHAPAPTSSSTNERRGSLYVHDLHRQRREAYKVEIRKPADEERRRTRRRRHDDAQPSQGYFL